MAIAHHSFSAFDQDKTQSLTGTVKKFEYTNPHSWIEILVKKPDGTTQSWGFEGQPPSQLRSHGWTSKSIATGDIVTVEFNPRRDGTPAGAFKSVRYANGKLVGTPSKPPGPGKRPETTGHPKQVHPMLADLVDKLKFFDPEHKGPNTRLTGKVMAASKNPRSLEGRYWPTGGLLMPGGMTRMMPYNDKSAAIFRKRVLDLLAGTTRPDPPTLCLPSGPIRPVVQGFPVQIMQGQDVILMMFMEDHITRSIHMKRNHPAQVKPTLMGDSIGHWEGNVLVVDTVGVLGGGWLDEYGSPSSEKLHLVERYSKLPNGDLRLEATMTDPVYYTSPVTYSRIFSWNPTAVWDEIICEENNRDAPGGKK